MGRPHLTYTPLLDQIWMDALASIESGIVSRDDIRATLGISEATLRRRLARARALRSEPATNPDDPPLRPVFASDPTIPLAQQTCADVHPDRDAPERPIECCMVCNHSGLDGRFVGVSRITPAGTVEVSHPISPAPAGVAMVLPAKPLEGLKGGRG